jgi:hypothetical protein
MTRRFPAPPPATDVVPALARVRDDAFLLAIRAAANGWPPDTELRVQLIASTLAARYGWGCGVAS